MSAWSERIGRSSSRFASSSPEGRSASGRGEAMRARFAALVSASVFTAGLALAVKRDAGAHRETNHAAAPQASASAPRAAPAGSSAPHEEPTWASCAEHVPAGATKPVLKDQFPIRATSGYAT